MTSTVKAMWAWGVIGILVRRAPIASTAADAAVAVADAPESGFTMPGKHSNRALFDCPPPMFHSQGEYPAAPGSTLPPAGSGGNVGLEAE